MAEYHVAVTTADGEMECFVAEPEGAGPFPPVILYMDVPGIREELREFARRIAAAGYLCLLPDLYYREGRIRFDLRKGAEELQRMFAVGSKLTNAMIMGDTAGMLEYLSSRADVTEKTGVIGYCMSGQFVLSAAGTFPERIGAAASLYGTRMVTDQADSPHKLAGQIRGELYLGFADHDPYVEDNVIPNLSAALDAAGVPYALEIHPGTEHGFCFPERPAYAPEAAERVWDAVFDLFKRNLGA